MTRRERHRIASSRDAELVVPVALSTAVLAVVAIGLYVGVDTFLLLAIAAAPLALVIATRWALGVVVVTLVARALVDNSGLQLLTGGLALTIIVVAILELRHAPRLVGPVLGAATYLFISAWAGAPTHGGDYTYSEALRLLSCLGVVIITVHAPGRLTLRSTAHVVQAVGVVPALLAVHQFLTGTGTMNSGVLRASGTLAHENSAAMLFALCNLATFALMLDSARRRWLHAGLLLVFMAAQLATGSIGGLVSAVVMVLTYLASAAVRRADRVLLGLLGVALGVYAALTSQIGAQRLEEYNGSRSETTSLEWRFEAWGAVLAAWRRNPLWGNGVGSTLSPSILQGNIPHNEYVRLLAELGVIGLAVVVFLTVAYARAMASRRRSSPYPAASAFAIAALTGTAVNAFAANTMLYSVSFYVTLFVLGACWRISQSVPGAVGEDSAPIERRWATDPDRTPTAR